MASYRVASLDELQPGQVTRIVAGEVPVCLARTADGVVYAIDDACPHEQASLAEGELMGTEVECLLHFSRFDLRTGEVTAPPAMTSVRTYPVTLEGRDVYIQVDGLDAAAAPSASR